LIEECFKENKNNFEVNFFITYQQKKQIKSLNTKIFDVATNLSEGHNDSSPLSPSRSIFMNIK